MADENLDNYTTNRSHKRGWIIAAIVLIVLLAFAFFYRKEESKTAVLQENDRQERLWGTDMDRRELLLDEAYVEEPGKAAAHEGISLYAKEKYEEAKEFLERAAEEGNADAKALLGKMYVFGRGVGQDIEKGVDYLEDAAERGSSYAMAELGTLYVEGRHNIERATDKGLDLIQRSIDGGKYYGYLAMAKLYEAGEGVERSVEKAAEYLKHAGERGYKYAAEEIDKLKEKL